MAREYSTIEQAGVAVGCWDGSWFFPRHPTIIKLISSPKTAIRLRWRDPKIQSVIFISFKERFVDCGVIATNIIIILNRDSGDYQLEFSLAFRFRP